MCSFNIYLVSCALNKCCKVAKDNISRPPNLTDKEDGVAQMGSQENYSVPRNSWLPVMKISLYPSRILDLRWFLTRSLDSFIIMYLNNCTDFV